jgi:hypothetical protein
MSCYTLICYTVKYKISKSEVIKCNEYLTKRNEARNKIVRGTLHKNENIARRI